jgi:outer membrane immunogenic protein
MKKVLLAGVAGIALVTGSAHAADLSPQPVYKAPPPAMAPVFSWTGCYIGGNIGGGWGRTTASAPSLAPGISLTGDTSGVIGGGQVGCTINSHPIG